MGQKVLLLVHVLVIGVLSLPSDNLHVIVELAVLMVIF